MSRSRAVLAAVCLLLLLAVPARAEQKRIAQTTELRAVPDPTVAATGGRAYAEQVVTVVERFGAWAHVVRFDGTHGWLPEAATAALPACRPRALGAWEAGRLACGWTLAARTDTWTTWDFPLRRAPARAWRRHGTDRLIEVLERVAGFFAATHAGRRVVVGDLSRPHGGPFGPEYGSVGHASHQNGLDADVYFPRRDGRERAADRIGQVDLPLARELIGALGREPAVKLLFVGCTRDFASASPKAERLCNAHHEDHAHVRLRRK